METDRMKKPVVLRIYKGDQLLGVKQFLESQIVVGRQGDAQIVLEGESVSLIHAVIEERDSGHYVCDLGSEKGTFRNGEPVLDSPILSGDVLQIGDYRLEFYFGVPKPKAPPPGMVPKVPSGPPTPTPTPTPASVPAVVPPEVTTERPPFEPVVAPADSPARVAQTKADVRASETKTPAPTQAPASVSTPVALAPTPIPVSAPAPVSLSGLAAGGAAVSLNLAGPRSKSTESDHKHKKRGRYGKTFAPASKYNSIREFVKPSKGSVVEVLVAWRERVIATYHFSQKKIITMGSHPDSDIVLPLFASRVRKLPILRLETHAIVMVSPEMTGELVRGSSSSSFVELVRQNRMVKDGATYSLILEQGEMIRLDLTDQVSVVVRYVSDSPKPLVAPLIDLTTSEFTGVVLSFVLVSILGLYMYLYTPPKPLGDGLNNEPMRTAMIIVRPTPPSAVPPRPKEPEAPAPTPIPPPPQVVKVTPPPKKVEEKKITQAKAAANLTAKNDPGMSANAAPNKNKTGPRQLTSPKQGGAIKTADKEGSQMKSVQKDISKSGVFSVFGTGGAQDQLAQNTNGAGELAGLANAATGRAGSAENRPGQGLGSKIKDTGVGGTGTALEGIAGGISTVGRGSGNSGYGTGGLGNRAGAKIQLGGTEESFSGTIDREAIRRVIQANLRVIRACYERQLNRNPDLFGKLVISWEIGEQGRVVSAHVKSNELGNREVGDCVVDRLKGWRFPEPPSNQVVEVSYPFFFSN